MNTQSFESTATLAGYNFAFLDEQTKRMLRTRVSSAWKST